MDESAQQLPRGEDRPLAWCTSADRCSDRPDLPIRVALPRARTPASPSLGGPTDRDGRVEWGGSQSAPEGVPEQTFASGPIGWTTRCLLSEMLDLSVFGLAAFYSNLTLTSSVFRLGVGGTLRTPLSEAEARMVTD